MSDNIAVCSDIHSNLPALEKFIKKTENCKERWCLGDIVGYGPWPKKCLDLVRENFSVIVQGNHDKNVGYEDYKSFGSNEMSLAGARLSNSVLDEADLNWLKNLPYCKELKYNNSYLLTHSSPKNRGDYVYPEDVDSLKIYLHYFDFILMGHTHVPFIEETESGFICNPGSIGQPRDGNPKASYMIISNGVPKIKRFDYNKKHYMNEARKLGLPRRSYQRLFSGK